MIGYTFFENNGFFWRKHQGAIIPLSMPHIDPKMSKSDAKQLLKKYKGLFVRWETNFDDSTEQEWWNIIKTEKESLEGLKSKVRNMVRRGGKEFEVRICDAEVIKNFGHDVYLDAFTRYDTFERIYNKREFVEAISTLPPETEFWGVFEIDGGNLVGFSENLVRDDASFYLTLWMKPHAMKKFAGYFLFHEMNKHYLNERNLKYVSDGSRSINHQTGIHDFLISKFGFRKAYCRLQVVYSTWLAVLVKVLFPFRGIIRKLNFRPAKKLSVLLEQHRIYLKTKNSFNFP
jgi:hypothetical protein